MSQDSRRPLAVLIVALLLALVALPGNDSRSALAGTPTVNDAIAEQQRMQAELAQRQDQLSELQRNQASLSSSLKSISGSLDKVGLEIDAAARQLDQLTAALTTAQAQLKDYLRQIASLEADLAKVASGIEQSKVDLAARQTLLQAHLRAAYEQSQTSVLEVLLSTDSLSDATNQLGFMLTLSDEDTRLAEEIKQARQRLEIKQTTLRNGRQTLAELRDSAAQRAAVLDQEQKQVAAAKRILDGKRRQLATLQADRESQLARTVQNAADQARLIRAQRRALEGQRVLVERLKQAALKLDLAFHGRFAWPERVDFVVTQEFGHTSFEQFHTGIDMAYLSPHCGGPIYATADGTVLADGRPNAAYGDTAIGVIIGHSQRLQSWYWHMSREIVSVGQKVQAGDLLGYEGATGVATGCHLHFQVMFNEQPVNPRLYLP
jgi:Membrane proteins related to metalloendopeptidases